jgi:hypothetical protein
MSLRLLPCPFDLKIGKSHYGDYLDHLNHVRTGIKEYSCDQGIYQIKLH